MTASPSLYDGYLAMAGPRKIRPPLETDAAAAHAIVQGAPPLELNSVYTYLLHAWHFADTCAIMEVAGEPSAYLAAYLPPLQPDTLFVWQIAVVPTLREFGLAHALILDVLNRPACQSVRFLDATVGEGNSASEALFRSLAGDLCTEIVVSTRFPAKLFGPESHASELLFHIGPIEKHHGNSQGG